jgi:hypothetical protein
MQRARGETPRKPKRNRGHLPSHLPRVERVIEPASTLCPVLRTCGEMAKIGEVEEDQETVRGTVSPTTVRAAGRDPGAVPRVGHAAAQICLPPLLAGRGAGACARACRARRSAHRTLHRLDYRLEIRRPPSVLPPGRDLQAPGDPSRSRHARQLGGPRVSGAYAAPLGRRSPSTPPHARDQPHARPSARRGPHLRG